MKKILTLVISVAIAFTFSACKSENDSPICSEQLSDIKFEFTLNDDMQSFSVVASDKDMSGDVIILNEYDSLPVTSVGVTAFRGYTGILSITIQDGINEIGSFAFYCCSNLAQINMPCSITKIGSWTFDSCTSLEKIAYNGTKEQWCAISKGAGWDWNTGNYTVCCTDGNISK